MVWDGRPVPTPLPAPVMQRVTTSSSSTSGTNELTVITALYTSDGVTEAEVVFDWYNVVKTVANDVFLMRLYDGSTLMRSWLLNVAITNAGGGILRDIWTPPAGVRTLTGRLVRSSGGGTAQMIAAAWAPAVLTVRPA